MRGFITTPLERAIAAADGIDYLESKSAQGLSTITARLKLNYDATKALAEISSKVDQVRRDLPPEAEVPIINIESADSQFASAYLSFTSDVLAQNEITDYLVRVVQPRLSAIEGVQRAEILGGAHLRHAHLAQAGSHGGAQRQPGAGAPGARRQQLPRRRRPDQGRAGAGQPHRQHRPALGGRVQAPRHARAGRQRSCACRDIADVVLGAEDYDTEVRFSGQTAVFMGDLVAAQRQLARRDQARAAPRWS